MSTNNKNLHLTDQDRIIIEKGIENSSTKAAIALTLVKDKSTIGKEIKATDVPITLHVQTKMNVLTIMFVLTALTLSLSNTIAETDPLVPATAVPNILIVVMTSLNILLILHTRNTEKNSLIPELVSI